MLAEFTSSLTGILTCVHCSRIFKTVLSTFHVLQQSRVASSSSWLTTSILVYTARSSYVSAVLGIVEVRTLPLTPPKCGLKSEFVVFLCESNSSSME